jgi:hypothetical protein
MYFARGTSDGTLCESGIRNDAPGKVFAGGCLCGQRGDHGQDLFSEFGWVMPAFTSGKLDKSADNLHHHSEDDEGFALWMVPTYA